MTTTRHDLILADPRPELAALEVLLEGDPRRSPWATIGPGLRPRHVRISREGMDSRAWLELPVEGDGDPTSWRVGARDLLDAIRAAADWRALAKAREPGRVSVELGEGAPRVGGVALFGEHLDDETPDELVGLESIAGSALAVGLEVVAGLGAPVAIGRASGEGPFAASIGARAIAVARGLDCADAVREDAWCLVPAAGARALALGVEGLLSVGRVVRARCVGGLEVELGATELPDAHRGVVRGLAPSESAEPIPRADLAAGLRASKVRGEGLVRVRHGGEVLDADALGARGGALVRADDLGAMLKALSGAPRVSTLARGVDRADGSRATWLELSRTIGPGAVVTIALAGFVDDPPEPEPEAFVSVEGSEEIPF